MDAPPPGPLKPEFSRRTSAPPRPSAKANPDRAIALRRPHEARSGGQPGVCRRGSAPTRQPQPGRRPDGHHAAQRAQHAAELRRARGHCRQLGIIDHFFQFVAPDEGPGNHLNNPPDAPRQVQRRRRGSRAGAEPGQDGGEPGVHAAQPPPQQLDQRYRNPPPDNRRRDVLHQPLDEVGKTLGRAEGGGRNHAGSKTTKSRELQPLLLLTHTC
jgi:hypothetical protein